jgi:hypothetical protein
MLVLQQCHSCRRIRCDFDTIVLRNRNLCRVVASPYRHDESRQQEVARGCEVSSLWKVEEVSKERLCYAVPLRGGHGNWMEV